ncbi:MAG: M48 family metalloprotease [Bacteroidales bacterium]|nr:M48 family metalloprotease [Bacteroidales bacterium]
MKKILSIVLAVTMLTGCGVLGRVNWNQAQLAQAASAALTAASISDAQIIALSQRTVLEQDLMNKIDNGAYAQRLARVLAGITEVEGIPINFKVYQKNEVNAFACGDGSIRVYSGLMDLMNDDELLAIIGHEIGHVVHQDTKRAMKNAYLTAAARGVIGAAGSVGAIASQALGDLGEMYISSQFSQKQEFAADDYGFQFSTKLGRDPYGMYNALNKLVKMAGGSQYTLVQKMFSSHPDSAVRAERIKEKADNYTK